MIDILQKFGQYISLSVEIKRSIVESRMT